MSTVNVENSYNKTLLRPSLKKFNDMMYILLLAFKLRVYQ